MFAQVLQRQSTKQRWLENAIAPHNIIALGPTELHGQFCVAFSPQGFTKQNCSHFDAVLLLPESIQVDYDTRKDHKGPAKNASLANKQLAKNCRLAMQALDQTEWFSEGFHESWLNGLVIDDWHSSWIPELSE